jgi:hypothetical protein
MLTALTGSFSMTGNHPALVSHGMSQEVAPLPASKSAWPVDWFVVVVLPIWLWRCGANAMGSTRLIACTSQLAFMRGLVPKPVLCASWPVIGSLAFSMPSKS